MFIRAVLLAAFGVLAIGSVANSQGGQTIEELRAAILAEHGPLAALDPALADYKPVEHVDGTVRVLAGDEARNVLTLWGEGFRKHYPNVRVEIDGNPYSPGFFSAPVGWAAIGTATEKLEGQILERFENRYGFAPTYVAMSWDALAVIVHPDNPLASLSLEELDAIFSKSRKLGHDGDISYWGQLGVGGDLAEHSILLHGRQWESVWRRYFQQRALGGGQFKDFVDDHPGASATEAAVADDPRAMGYIGASYVIDGVKAVAVAPSSVLPPVEMSLATIESGEYPLSRFLYLAVDFRPGTRPDLVHREFIKFGLSKQGQEAVALDGLLPLSAKLAREQLARLGLASE